MPLDDGFKNLGPPPEPAASNMLGKELDKRKFLFHLNESMLGISSGLKHDSFIEVLLRFFQLLIDVLMYFFFCPLYFICKSIVLFILKLHQ